MRALSFRSLVALLLVVPAALAVASASVVVTAIRVPAIVAEKQRAIEARAGSIASSLELLLHSVERPLQALSIVQPHGGAPLAPALLDRVIGGNSALIGIYVVSRQGTVLSAGVAPRYGVRRVDFIGSDLSQSALVRDALAHAPGSVVWSDKYLSLVSGDNAVGVAIVTEGGLLVGELELQALVAATVAATADPSVWVWVIDQRGEVLADTQFPGNVGISNLASVAAIRDLVQADPGAKPTNIRIHGADERIGTAYSRALAWHIVTRQPDGLGDPDLRSTLILLLGIFGGALAVSAVTAPLWSRRLTAAIQRMAANARQIVRGEAPDAWPTTRIVEFDALSRDLASMASGLRERESRLRAIFDAAPVPMLVIDARRRSVIDINAAWKVQFGTARSAAIGRPADEVVRLSGGDRWGNAPWSPGWPGGGAEIDVVGPDSMPMRCEVRARQAVIDTGTAIVASFKDVTDTRRMETELRDLNARLEVRVAERTREIEAANRELSQVVQTLRVAQDELVRAEKLASLGRVVAGVAHELNTPIGNALLAATGFQERTREFAAAVEGGLRRKTLGEFIEGATAAGDLVVRGLQRAATLVATFKRVAIDQTSEQRRAFSLKATIEEISATAAPGVKRASHRLEVHVADDVAMDSYPGALGQILLNLIGNAVAHAFDGREGGTVRVLARQAGGDLVELTVADDGNGIDPAVVDRIFDPFFTTKRGRGGTGLGLHIVHNAVTRVLGGRIAVRSAPGAGADFVVTMPRVAPAESVPADRPYV